MTIEEQVISIIEKNIENKVPVKIDSNLIDDLGIDSFGRLMIVNAIEDEYNVSITQDDLNNIKTVSDIISSLEKVINK